MTPDYPALKAVHVTCVAVSYLLFVTRGIWMVRDSRMLERRWVRIVPHLNDTILLASAIALVWTIRQYPFVAGWLTAKVVALLAYIELGMIALGYGRTKAIRVAPWIAAQAVFLYMVAVALTRDPLPGFPSPL